jgi:hypothetical protein
VLSNGMREEYEIAKDKGLFLIPIGSTGYMAEQLWGEQNSEIQKSTNISNEMKQLFEKLGDRNIKAVDLIDLVTQIINLNNGE